MRLVLPSELLDGITMIERPPLGMNRRGGKIDHARHAGEMVLRQGICRHLPRQIDGRGDVDGGHPRVAGNDRRIVDVIGGMELQAGVVVDKAIELLGPDGGRCDDLPLVATLATVRHVAGQGQVHEPVRHVLRVNTQIVLRRQGTEHSSHRFPQPQLQRGPILDKVRYELRDALLRFVVEQIEDGQQFLVLLHKDVDLVDVEKPVAQGPGHPGIDLGDDRIGSLCGGQRNVHRNAQAHKAEFVRHRHLDQGKMDGELLRSEKTGDRGDVHRREEPFAPRQGLRGPCPLVDAADRKVVPVIPVGEEGRDGPFQAEHPHNLQV